VVDQLKVLTVNQDSLRQLIKYYKVQDLLNSITIFKISENSENICYYNFLN